jgi:hypothetical protein
MKNEIDAMDKEKHDESKGGQHPVVWQKKEYCRHSHELKPPMAEQPEQSLHFAMPVLAERVIAGNLFVTPASIAW